MTISRHVFNPVSMSLLFLVVLSPIACKSDSPQSSPPLSTVTNSTPMPPFDGNRAFSTLVAQCQFGPRVPNRPAHDACRTYIMDQIRPYVDTLVTQDFTYRDTSRKVLLHMTNILGVLNPAAANKVMICAHWDSRPTADEDMTQSNKTKAIPGADDGASGVSVLMELARTFVKERPKVGVVLAFWDGEDWGPDDAHMYLGADYFTRNMSRWRPGKAVLIDMIGQKGLRIPKEQFSYERQPDLENEVYQDAADLGYSSSFPMEDGPAITDDHIPMLDAGIPTIDLIDFDYQYWHTLQDTPDKCSPQSLQIVGTTLEKFVYDQAQ